MFFITFSENLGLPSLTKFPRAGPRAFNMLTQVMNFPSERHRSVS